MTPTPVPVLAALGDDTRWSILVELSRAEASASALARRLPISRQAIAKHMRVLETVGLVERQIVGKEVRYQAVGATLSDTARRLEQLGVLWDRRLQRIKELAEAE